MTAGPLHQPDWTLSAWHAAVRAHGCVISENPHVHLHHCHGGSMNRVLPAHMRPGMGQRVSDWLVIPLAPAFHTGEFGIDAGMGRYQCVEEWEAELGRQVDHLDKLCIQLRCNAWAMAGLCRDLGF